MSSPRLREPESLEYHFQPAGGVLVRGILWVIAWSFATLCSAAFCSAGALPMFDDRARLLLGLPLLFSLLMLVKFPTQINHLLDAPTRRGWIIVCVEGAMILGGVLMFERFLYPAEIAFDLNRCEAIVRAIQAGNLPEEPSGTVVLPPGLSGATLDGKVYVTHRPNGTLYLFKTVFVRDREQDFRGYVYSTVPPDDPAMHQVIEGVEVADLRCLAGLSSELVVMIQSTREKRWLRATSWGLRNASLVYRDTEAL